jgi:hypothetical protein
MWKTVQIANIALWGLLVISSLAIMAFLLFINSGCIDNVRVTPASTRITETISRPDVNGKTFTVSSRTVESQSIGIRGRAESVDIKKIKAPSAMLGIGTAGGNAGDVTGISFEALADSPFLWLYIIGGLLIAGGIVVAIWLKQVKLGIALAVAGVALIAACVLFDRYPWVCLVGLGIVLIGGTVWLIYYFRNAAAAKAALSTVTTVIEKSATDVKEAVKSGVAQATAAKGNETVVRAAIKTAKGT